MVLLPQVDWAQQQVVKPRVKRQTQNDPSLIHFNDPKWSNMWYIVSAVHRVIHYLHFDNTRCWWCLVSAIYVSLQHCNDKSSHCHSEMNILAAWQRGYTGKNVVVTILDDGIERNHPDLAQNYVWCYPSNHLHLHRATHCCFHKLCNCEQFSQLLLAMSFIISAGPSSKLWCQWKWPWPYTTLWPPQWKHVRIPSMTHSCHSQLKSIMQFLQLSLCLLIMSIFKNKASAHCKNSFWWPTLKISRGTKGYCDSNNVLVWSSNSISKLFLTRESNTCK